MTEIDSLIAGIDNLIGYEIAKDMSRDDMPVVRNYFRLPSPDPQGLKDYVEGLIKHDSLPTVTLGDPGPGAPPTKPAANLSIKVEKGKNLYLIRLANTNDGLNYDTRAKWGPGNPPIGFLPENIYGANKPLKGVQLAYAEGTGDQKKVKYIPEAAIPHAIDDVPDGAWIIMRCDFDDMQKLWVDLGYEPTRPFVIPFRYNLFDRATKRPIWNVDHVHPEDDDTPGSASDDHDHDHDHTDGEGHDHMASAKGVLTHGGKHPNSDKGLMTHGGKHPNDSVALLASGSYPVKRGRTHGGIHPNGLIEYFYYDPPKSNGGSGLI